MSDIVERLREVFQQRRYGEGAEYHPDFDLFDAAADEIERLREFSNDGFWAKTAREAQELVGKLTAEIDHLRAVAGAVSLEVFNYADVKANAKRAPHPEPGERS